MSDNMLHNALDKVKEIIGIEKFDHTKILTDTDDKLPDDIICQMIEKSDINDMCYKR